MSTNLGDPVLKKLTTARLYWLKPGTDGYIDFGNVTDYKDDPKMERVSHMQAKKGFKRLDFELIKQVGVKKSFTLDEHFNELLKLYFLSGDFANLLQVSTATADSTSLTADETMTVDEIPAFVINNQVLGRAYYLGYQNVSNVVVTSGGVVINPSTYVLDAAAGMLTILVTTNHPWIVNFGAAQVTDLDFQVFSNLLTTGAFKFVEFDQFSQVPLFTETFNGQVYVTGWGDDKTDAFEEITIEVYVTQNLTRTQRST